MAAYKSRREQLSFGTCAVVCFLAAAAILAVLPVYGGGCATVDATARNDDQLLRTERERRQVSTQPTVRVRKLEVVGSSVGISLMQEHACQDIKYPVYQRTRRTERHGRSFMGMHPLLWEFGVGGLLAAAGASSYFGADSLAAKEEAPSTGAEEESAPSAQTYRIVGASMAGVGLVLAGLGVVDGIRMRDSVEDLGVVRGAEEVTPLACQVGPVASRAVHLRLSDSSRIAGVTDQQGVVHVSLLAAPAIAFSAPGGLGTLQAQDGSFTLPVRLTPEQSQQLLTALIRNPRSRAGADLLREQKQRCRQRVEAVATSSAQATTIAAFEQAKHGYEEARQVCGEHWLADDQTKAQLVLARIAELEQQAAEERKREAEQACKEALENLRSRAPEHTLEELQELADQLVADTCSGNAAAPKVVAEIKASAEAREKARREQEQLAGELDRVATQVRNSEVEQARGALARDTRLNRAAKLHEALQRAAYEAVRDAVGEVLRTSRTGPAATRMCHARKLFVDIHGKPKWLELRKSLAEKFSEQDPVGASKLLQALEAGTCR